ncbi:MAG: 16S rRNA (adenine(1518)-N(6)/adenine(1519)-N(6))-dimethyltransferase RsmA [Woeseiaceae bacterium]|nr:16S rRNA (adenine(1518)-N(6)/adenine(1519)-N(6))-dimethyltransferase RsmA [Woeseiaceae bacterium]
MPSYHSRKRFGQHFLIDPDTINAILRSISPSKKDIVVEIGPGRGAITTALAADAGHLHAIELDRDLVKKLKYQYRDNLTVSIHEADALSFDYSTLGDGIRIVGNLPYNISTPLLFHLLKFRDYIIDMHFMLQKEVVDRMVATPGTKAYGRLGIMLGCHLNIDSLFNVDKSAFDPPPNVTSAVVQLSPLPPNTFDIQDDVLLSKIVVSAFMKRRKTIRNSLRDVVEAADLEAVNIDSGLRPEQISILKYIELSNHLASRFG